MVQLAYYTTWYWYPAMFVTNHSAWNFGMYCGIKCNSALGRSWCNRTAFEASRKCQGKIDQVVMFGCSGDVTATRLLYYIHVVYLPLSCIMLWQFQLHSVLLHASVLYICMVCVPCCHGSWQKGIVRTVTSTVVYDFTNHMSTCRSLLLSRLMTSHDV